MLKSVALNIAKLDDKLDKVNKIIIICLVGIMAAIVFLGVVSRALSYSLSWTQELSEFTFVWLSTLGTVYVFRQKGHIVLDAFNSFISPKVLPIVIGLGHIILAVFFILLVLTGTKLAITYVSATSPVLGLSVGLNYLCIPIAAALMILHQLRKVFDILIQK